MPLYYLQFLDKLSNGEKFNGNTVFNVTGAFASRAFLKEQLGDYDGANLDLQKEKQSGIGSLPNPRIISISERTCNWTTGLLKL